ncbi:MAG: 4-carboxy-4-hydroxy-2-oxoadipate aldolase/oxaloacetate decarboxylase [Syntrophorhabdaceae bacterium]|nr:4-carboxy-4-hydroxy-2-oxoadipate aldolase/oxaloacetate decarboxylase [Syntrophorhabdaceae bacterium]
MERYIVKNIPRCDEEICEEFARLGVATVFEAQGQIGLMEERIKPIQQGVSVCGPAVTVICPAGDNLMIHAAVECCQKGDILVVTTIGEANKHGMVGELLVSSFMKRGVRALIMDGGVRDTMEIKRLNFPVWTTAVICTGTTKNKAGWVNAPAVCAGVIVEPGDLIVADDDGVVVVKRGEIKEVLEKSLARKKKEEGTAKKIEEGQLGVDFYGFRDVLAKLGVKYYETLEDVSKKD